MNSARVFISYAKSDYNIVKRIIEQSIDIKNFQYDHKRYYVSCWWDPDIKPSILWKPQIKEEMECADVIVFMLSKNFFTSDFIRDYEIPLALQRYESGITLLGVYIDSCKFSHSELKRIQLVPQSKARLRAYKNWSPRSKAISRIKTGFKYAVVRSIHNIPWVLPTGVPEGFSEYDQKIFRNQFLKLKFQEAHKTKKRIDNKIKIDSGRKRKRFKAPPKRVRMFLYKVILLVALLKILMLLITNT